MNFIASESEQVRPVLVFTASMFFTMATDSLIFCSLPNGTYSTAFSAFSFVATRRSAFSVIMFLIICVFEFICVNESGPHKARNVGEQFATEYHISIHESGGVTVTKAHF